MTLIVGTPGPQRAELDEELALTFGKLADRIATEFPDIARGDVLALLAHAHAELAPARVQAFRLVLTERAVRRRLRSRKTTS